MNHSSLGVPTSGALGVFTFRAFYRHVDVYRPIPTLTAIPVARERNNSIFRTKSTASHKESMITGRRRLIVNDPRLDII